MFEDVEKQLITENFVFKDGEKYLESSGIECDWPDAHGIFHNYGKAFLLWVNEEGQLRIIFTQNGSNILKLLERLSFAAQKF